MLTQLFYGKFFKHLLGSNLILIVVMFIYNLLTYFIPLVKPSLACSLCLLIIIDLILIILKILAIITSQQS